MPEVIDVALLTFIGSRVASRPMVRTMFENLENAGLASSSTLLQAYDERTSAALSRPCRSLPIEM